MHKETTIHKWGNSLALRLSKELAHKLALREGSRVEIREDKRGILVRPTLHRHRSLTELVRMIQRDNLHTAIPWGRARGKEVW